jgi:uncharacterized protein YaiL (DUF2058 family)
MAKRKAAQQEKRVGEALNQQEKKAAEVQEEGAPKTEAKAKAEVLGQFINVKRFTITCMKSGVKFPPGVPVEVEKVTPFIESQVKAGVLVKAD